MENGNNLPPLPRSDHNFWDKAEKHRIELIKKPACEHYFEYGKEGREIVCKKCNVGFLFTGKEYIENGQIGIRM